LHAHWRETGAFRGETLLDVIDRAAREDPDALLVIASDTHPGTTRIGDLPERAVKSAEPVVAKVRDLVGSAA